jgi:TPP-dependent pyruvate/acetoin dehydrogenase alpha subunit
MNRFLTGERRMASASSSTRVGQLYERMYLIRRVEESLLDLFSAGKLVGTTHTCIGQEANAVGVISHLEQGRDTIVSNHRCHGHYLAFTDDVHGLLCEVMGKEDGVCGGKGGSQHLCNGNFYSNGVLGSTVPLATGMALAERERETDGVVVTFVGDGTLGQGVVYESLNIASKWELPILYVVENNFYAQSTPSHLTLAGTIPARGSAFGVETAELATTDVLEIESVASEVISGIRASRRPYFLVLDTYRFSPHSKGDDHRDPAEIEEARTRDPLPIAAAHLDDDERSAVERACEARLEQAIAAAEASAPARPAS